VTTEPQPEEASKADQVHRRLREEIELGELAPGTPLSELSLVAGGGGGGRRRGGGWGVSRTSNGVGRS
jgi:hypothetical protein